MKKIFAIMLAAAMVLSLAACGGNGEANQTSEPADTTAAPVVTEAPTEPEAAEVTEAPDLINGELIVEEGDPNFDELDTMTWMQYEFNQDYSQVFSNSLCYDLAELRHLLDVHWGTYTQLIIPDMVTEEEARELLKVWHNTRVTMEPVTDVESARIYLWPEGQVPTITEYTDNSGYMYADDPGFQPYMIPSLVEGEAKGAVIVACGGGHVFRSAIEEGYEVCKALNEQGYHAFMVNYRVDPYTDEESALDIARAIRIVRANAAEYGIEEDHIAAAGFSYGGIVTSLAANDFYGDITPAKIIEGYVPDEIDAVDASLNAYLAIYSVTTDEITNENFPATFFGLGGDDGVTDWVLRCYDECREEGVRAEIHIFAGVPHGFGAGTHASGVLYENAATWPMLADCFMQDVYLKADQAEAAAAEAETAE